MTTCLGLAVFDVLCRCGNALDALREETRPGSEAWLALTCVVQAIDVLIDAVVDGPAIEAEEDTCD